MIELDKSKLKEVTSIDLFEKDKIRFKYIEQDGLLSEVIFGPTRSWRCSSKCLELTSKTDNGKVCKKCGVKCTSNNVRYRHFGKIVLPFSVIRSTKRRNFQQLVKGKEFNHILDPKRNDLSSNMKSFLKYDKFDPEKLELTSKFDPTCCIPLNITGIYSLYLSFKVAYEYIGNAKAKEYLSYFYDELLVVPPNSRFTTLGEELGKKKIVYNDLDQVYLKILYLKRGIVSSLITEAESELMIETGTTSPKNIKEKDKLIKATELFKSKIDEFYEMITNTIEAQMLEAVDDPEIQSFDEAISVLQFRCDSVYDYIDGQLSGKEGLIRKDFLGRYIDFSGRTVIIPDPTLDTHQVKLSKRIFIRLWLIEYSRWLWKIKDIPFEKIKLFVKSTDIHDGYLEHVDEFAEYFFKNTSQKERLIFLNRQPTLWRLNIASLHGNV